MRLLNYLELEGPLERSGIGTAARQQRRALDRAGVDVDVVTSPWQEGSLLSAAAALGNIQSPVREFDIAHCNLFGPGSVAVARTARRRGVPLVCHAHSTGEDFAGSFRGSDAVAPALRRYLRWFYSQADLVIAPSAYAKRLLEENDVGAPIRPLTNGVDVDSLAGHETLREPYRDRYDLDGTVVFTVGNVFERKGLTDFCGLARDLGDPYEFVWFGSYDTGLQASKVVRRWVASPPANVTFTGWVDDKRGAFGAGDIYLFATKEETQGVAALEAMACGKPCVLRDLPVFREYYTDGEDCLFASDRAEMREAIQRIAEDPQLATRLGENARETAMEHRLEHVGTELYGIYRDLLADTDPREVAAGSDAHRDDTDGAPGSS